MPTTCVFATVSELPSITDTAYLALQGGHQNAVNALARVMQRQTVSAAIPVQFAQYVS